MASTYRIIKQVCKYYNIRPTELKCKCRAKRVVKPKQVIMYFMTQQTPLLQNEIGKYFGHGHCMVIYARDLIKAEIEIYPKVRHEIGVLKSRIISSQGQKSGVNFHCNLMRILGNQTLN